MKISLDQVPIRIRIAMGHAVGMAVIFFALGFGLNELIETTFAKAIDTSLVASAKSIREVRNQRPQEQELSQFTALSYTNSSDWFHFDAFWIDFNDPQDMLFAVSDSSFARAEKGLYTLETIKKDNLFYRSVILPLDGWEQNKLAIQVVTPLKPAFRYLRNVRILLWIVLPSGLLFAILIGYFFSGMILYPVTALSRKVSYLNSENLDTKLKLPQAKDEIRDLTLNVNGLLDRLSDSFYRAKRFAGDVSHELRTPLTVIRGEAEFSLRKPRSLEEYKETLDNIQREAVLMSNMVEDLLLLAKAENKTAALKWEKIEMVVFLKELQNLMYPQFLEKKLKLEIEMENNVYFYASKTYMIIALKNILQNAAKHSPAESRIRLKTQVKLDQIQFEIKDFGEGIAPQSLPYVFDTFFRVDSARNRDEGGTGIGLSICKALVELHGGTIHVKSKVKQGANFIVTIPLYRDIPDKINTLEKTAES